MSSKKTTKQHTENSLPAWLTSPYQQATQAATDLYKNQPGIGTGTQSSLDQIVANAGAGRTAATGALGSLSSLAAGNFGQPALTGAANGDFLGARSGSTALDAFNDNGALDLGYINDNQLQRTAAGDFLTPDSNPFIKSVADRAADTAQARINAQFGAAGRSNGSGLYAQLFSQGIGDAANSVYASNYENERQRQLAAQGQLLTSEQAAREAALGRQYGAAGAQFGADTSAFEAERQRQQQAAGGLINTQLQSASQIPSILQAMMNGDISAFTANQYQDNAPYNNLAKYTGLLSTLAAPFGISDSKTTEKTGGLGSTIGTLAQAGGALASMASGNPFAGLFGAAGGAGGINLNPNAFNGAAAKAFG